MRIWNLIELNVQQRLHSFNSRCLAGLCSPVQLVFWGVAAVKRLRTTGPTHLRSLYSVPHVTDGSWYNEASYCVFRLEEFILSCLKKRRWTMWRRRRRRAYWVLSSTAQWPGFSSLMLLPLSSSTLWWIMDHYYYYHHHRDCRDDAQTDG